MSWLGKVVGGAFGFFFMGGPLGAVLGAALGHQFDRNLKDIGLLESDFVPGAEQRVQMAFFTATFSIMGHIAKADGRVTAAEIEAARAVMARMELPLELRKAAIRLYNEGKRPDFPFDAALEQFRSDCHRRYSLFRVFVEIQLETAMADGLLQDAQERLLLRLCERLSFSRFEFHILKARMAADRRFAGQDGRYRQWGNREMPPPRRTTLAEAYALLGIPASAPNGEVKRAYRRLMSRHHPDKLVAKGSTEHQVRAANEKTQQIRRAYELISKTRKL